MDDSRHQGSGSHAAHSVQMLLFSFTSHKTPFAPLPPMEVLSSLAAYYNDNNYSGRSVCHRCWHEQQNADGTERQNPSKMCAR
eukprot:scaffold303_cov46-Attheya_sp.AAC.1